jgi:3'-phosphoadenosine 5'-phosphosulfate sulfotransferase (PAPS reductase)/FAD synthetase
MPFDPSTSLAKRPPEPRLDTYSRILVMFSGGKDSLACLLHLFELGVPRERIELWHHDVDGREGSDLMDWPCTRDYCRAIAEAFDLPLYYSWKKGGFEREMLRQEQRTAPICFEVPGGHVEEVGGTAGKFGTRRKFPQVSANLMTRWCSAYLKIDVAAAAIRAQHRFREERTLVITGERAQESSARSKYAQFEPHRSDRRDGKRVRRHVDHWRPVHQWSEQDVWAIIERWRVQPHPAYRLGWGRVSCAACIFGSPKQWASLRQVAPERFERIAQYEEEFGVTIQRKRSVRRLAVLGQPYEATTADPDLVAVAMSREYTEPVLVAEGQWELPAGAYGDSCGPS